MNSQQDDGKSQPLNRLITELRSRPWWGYTCICFGAMLTAFGAIDVLSRLTGTDLSVLNGLCSLLLVPGLLMCLVATLVSRFVREEPPDNGPALKLAGVLAAVGIGFTMLALLLPAVEAARAASASADVQVHRFANGQARISVPGNWLQNEPLSKQAGVPVFSDLNKGLHLSVNAIRREGTVARSFQQFASQGSQTLQSQFVRSQVLESRESANGRFRFIETQFECVVDTIKVRNLLRYIDGGDIWIEARAWGPASVVQENTALAQQTFDSIEPVQ